MATKVKIPSNLFRTIGKVMMLAAQWEAIREHVKSIAENDPIIAGFYNQLEELMKDFRAKK
jgi:hypothetical protein